VRANSEMKEVVVCDVLKQLMAGVFPDSPAQRTTKTSEGGTVAEVSVHPTNSHICSPALRVSGGSRW
jgi:hypothetical protein